MVYLHEYQTMAEARESLKAYFEFYNPELVIRLWATGRCTRFILAIRRSQN